MTDAWIIERELMVARDNGAVLGAEIIYQYGSWNIRFHLKSGHAILQAARSRAPRHFWNVGQASDYLFAMGVHSFNVDASQLRYKQTEMRMPQPRRAPGKGRKQSKSAASADEGQLGLLGGDSELT